MRSAKQIIILVITVFVLGLAISAGSFVLSRVFPGEDPEEEPYQTPYATPDPGPALESIEVLDVGAFRKQGNTYDILLHFRNPNPEHGAEELRYSVVFSSGGSELDRRDETTYILPGEEKYIVLSNVTAPSGFTIVDADMRSVSWTQISEFVSLKLDVFDLKLERMPETSTFTTRLAAFIENNSLFGLTDIRVSGILFDSRGEAIAVNRTSIQTVLEGEMREVEMFWPQDIPLEDVSEYKVYAYSNVLKDDNFVRQYGGSRPGTEAPRRDSEPQNYFQLPELFQNFKGWSPF